MSSTDLGNTDSRTPVAIIGGGNIGVAFAVVFACAKHPVCIFEPHAKQRDRLPEALGRKLQDLDSFDLLPQSPDAVGSRVRVSSSLAKAVRDAAYVQECAPESRALKEVMFGQLDRTAPPNAVLASSSSAMPASEFTSELPGRRRCLVVHPGNPPFLLRVVEIVPAPFTDPTVVSQARDLLAAAGLAPVLVRKEVKGFIFNRLQGALLREAYCLVRDGVASVDDIDLVVRDGLGLRWSVIGPFETADLNSGGITRHAALLGPAYAEMGAERGQIDPWSPALVAEVEARRRELLPIEQLDDRIRWRDRALMALVSMRQRLLSSPDTHRRGGP